MPGRNSYVEDVGPPVDDAPPAADVEDGSYTDADMLRATALAGQAYTDRLDDERRANVDDRTMAMLIVDDQEMAELYAALGSRTESAVSTPLHKQIGEWLDDIESDVAGQA